MLALPRATFPDSPSPAWAGAAAAGRGSVVNVSSLHGFVTLEGFFPYAAAKSGLLGLTRSLALDYGDDG